MLDLATLVITNSDSARTLRFPLKTGTHLIGSDPSCDVVIDSPFIAPQQLQLTVSSGRVAIEPAGESVNTLLVGGQTITGPRTFPFPQSIDLGPITIHLDNATDATLASGQSVGDDSIIPPAGTNDRYRLGPEIARGGMGVVIEAEETSLERTVAMKRVLEATATGMERAQERFIREAKILGKLEHPNIVPVHELGEDSWGIPFYTMKKVEGHTLQDVINGL